MSMFRTEALVFLLFSLISLHSTCIGQTDNALPTAESTTPTRTDQDTPTMASGQTQVENPASDHATTNDDSWIQLFNGTDLTGWTPKIVGHKLGDNYADTFRVVDGLLTVAYDKYVDADFMSMDGKRKPTFEKFGHLFYKDTFSNYILRAEYRLIGEQVKNGPAWAIRNNGLMLHGQDPATMAIDQKFPVSIEVQLLAGNGTDERSTVNLCTPGTNVVIDGKLFLPHCTSSTSPTFHGDQWVTVEIEVHGNDVIRHKIDGVTYLEYRQPQLDERDPEGRLLIVDGNRMLDRGTISIQSESAPTQFRKIELLNLDEK
jgi:hypothetical protein